MSKPRIIKLLDNGGNRVVKIYSKDEADEYRAALFVGGVHYEPADAFDDDRESIEGTAYAMLIHTEKCKGLS